MKALGMGQPACERCRGQKLRCIRNHQSQASCNRCEKAGAQCTVNPAVRMGRPPRDKTQPREVRRGQRQMSLSTALTDTPASLQGRDAGNGIPHSLVGAETSTPNNFGGTEFLAQDPLNFEETMIWEEKARLFGTDSDFESPFDFTTNPEYPDSVHHQSVTDTAHDLGFSPSKMMPGIEPGSEITESAKNSTNMEVEALPIVASHQTYVEQMSKLNTDLYHQAKITGVATEKCPLDGCGIHKLENEQDISRFIGIMIQGLQTFQKVVRGMVDSQATISNSKPTTTSTSRIPQAPKSNAQSPVWQYLNTPTSPQGSPRAENSSTSTLPALPQQEISLTDSESPNPLPPQASSLDLPISLLVISCYMNLTQLCCNVLVSIRCILTSHGSQSISAALSSELQICGVSLKQDSELQLMLLVQVVIRLLDQIEILLGWQAQEREIKHPGTVISSQLLSYLLESKEKDGGRVCNAVREEIEKLNKIIGRHA